jgi:hypothetical protein
VRVDADPCRLAPGQLRELAVDVLGWLGWQAPDGARPAGRGGPTAMVLAPPGGARMTLHLEPSPVEPVPDRSPATTVWIECEDGQGTLAGILLDEIHGAVSRLTDRQGNTT